MPLVWVGMGEAPEINFQTMVHALHLAIGLGVVCHGVQQLGARRGENFLPHRAGEHLVTVGDDGVRHAMELDDVFPERAGDLSCREGMAERHEVRVLGEPVDDDHNGIVALRFGKSFEEIHGQFLPWFLLNRQRLELVGRVRVLVLGVLAHGALLDEIFHGTLQPVPGEQLADAVVGGRGTGVTTHCTVMERGDEFGLQRRVCANLEPAALPGDAVLQCAALVVGGGDRELGQQLLRVKISFIGVGHLLHPIRLARGECGQLELFAHARERVGDAVVQPPSVLETKL